MTVVIRNGGAYPMAKVPQSMAGANAVMGSNIVRAEMCSDVAGSNKMTLPCELPFGGSVASARGGGEKFFAYRTQCCRCASRPRP